MKLLLILSLVLAPLMGFADAKKPAQKREAASAAVEDGYENEACGSLYRIRYENHGKKGAVVKLLIENINIKFYKKDVSYDDAVLASALANKKIKVCYQPKNADRMQFLDFYVE